jgi:hypothetical protein
MGCLYEDASQHLLQPPRERREKGGQSTDTEDTHLKIRKRMVVSIMMDPSPCTRRKLWPCWAPAARRASPCCITSSSPSPARPYQRAVGWTALGGDHGWHSSRRFGGSKQHYFCAEGATHNWVIRLDQAEKTEQAWECHHGPCHRKDREPLLWAGMYGHGSITVKPSGFLWITEF